MKLLSLLLLILIVCSCVSLKPHERQYVNDPEMAMGQDTGMNFCQYVHAIREGSTPAGGSKSSGGCGCN